jgi:hypothetical protein
MYKKITLLDPEKMPEAFFKLVLNIVDYHCSNIF